MHLRKRVLVTGGAGFLGSFLCERLLQEGCDVICCDNFYTGSKRNVAHLLDNPYFEIIRHDITFPLYLEVDEIYNLACPASPIHYQNDPVQTTKVNVHGARSAIACTTAKFQVAMQNGRPVVVSVDGRPTTAPDLTNRFTLSPTGQIIESGEVSSFYLNDGQGRFTLVPFTGGAFLDEDGKALTEPPRDWGS